MLLSTSGLISSGKDTFAKYLINNYGFQQFSFADSVKEACCSIFGWDIEMISGLTPESRLEREKVDKWWANRLNIPEFSPRWALQHFGTDVCRNHFHNEIWIASLENKLFKQQNQNVIVTDARFINELQMIKKLDGTCIYIERGVRPSWFEYAKRYNNSSMPVRASMRSVSKFIKEPTMFNQQIHPSEWEWIGFPFDYEIENNGTISDLFFKANDLIINLVKNREINHQVSTHL
jgi:hypothetical protein